ncbi:MAG: SelL-related redox protein [Planctomycetota bacterium]
MSNSPNQPWMTWTLYAAGAYNLLWGTWVITRPMDMFRWTGIPEPTYPGIWQCVGMIVGVYGIGYAVAGTDPIRHWPIVLVGFLGKVLGPIGMLQNVLFIPEQTVGRFPASWLWLNVTNDLIWIIPFAGILYAAFKNWNQPDSNSRYRNIADANASVMTQHGNTLAELNHDRNVLLLFLRHSGCTFCREALADVQQQRQSIEQHATIVLVHMGVENDATNRYFDHYKLSDVHRISDPDCKLYRTYDLPRGRLGQLFGPSVWLRGFSAAILGRHAVGPLGGDGFQMSGTFVVRNDRIEQRVQHQTVAERPDYCDLVIAPSR